MDKYSASVQWSDEDNGFIATIPELPGLSAFGNTRDEALEELMIAKGAFLKVYKEDGCQLPEPDILNTYSGQIRLRLPKSLHAELTRVAKSERLSFNSYVVYLLSERNIAKKCMEKISEVQVTCKEIQSNQFRAESSDPFVKPSTEDLNFHKKFCEYN
jgi:predicted RNase H-like HicB family nuclease